VPDLPSPAVAVTWAGGTATIAVRQGLDAAVAAQVREQIIAVAGSGPQRVLLDLEALGNRFDAESLALIAVARHLLPPECALDTHSASLAVRRILGLAGQRGPGPG